MKKIIFIIIFFSCSNSSAIEICKKSINETYSIEKYNNGIIKTYDLYIKNKYSGSYGIAKNERQELINWSSNTAGNAAHAYSQMLLNNNISTMNICKK